MAFYSKLPRVFIITPDLASNSLGRAYALSLVLDSLKVDWSLGSLYGEAIWPPLADSDFADKCRKYSAAELEQELITAPRVIVVKPLPESFGFAVRALDGGQSKLILDIDDPDLELRLGWWMPLQRAIRACLRPALVRELHWIKNLVPEYPVIVSNPELQKIYGGSIIPHVRLAPRRPHRVVSAPRKIAFIGTPRRHKGLKELRKAILRVNRDYFPLQLVVTAPAPKNSMPWEKWVGPVRLSEGGELLAGCSATVISIWNEPYKSLQLPAKAIDAAIIGLPVIRNETPNLNWVFGNSGLVLKGKSVAELVLQLRGIFGGGGVVANFEEQQKRFSPEEYRDTMSRLLMD
ncbi:hypothetical protein N8964_00700 [Pontimonas sp.]|nr:hypothetical protein [Pontimonas sp.]